MATPLVHFCNRLNKPASAPDYLFGFVLLASILTFEVTALSIASNPVSVELARHQNVESLR